jgi:hypothetical protein
MRRPQQRKFILTAQSSYEQQGRLAYSAEEANISVIP